MLAILLAGLAITSMCACGGNKSDLRTDGDNNNTTDSAPQNGAAIPGKYLDRLDYLTYSDELYSTPYEIVTDYETPYNIDKDGNYYTIYGKKLEFAIKPAKFFSGSADISYWDADGNFYLYPSPKPYAVDDNLVYAYKNEYNECFFYSLKDGELYITIYASDGECLASNERLYLIYDNVLMTSKIKSYMFTSECVVLLLEDGNCYFDYHGVDNNYSESRREMEFYHKIEHIDKVLACPAQDQYRNLFDTPIYSKTDDDKNLYFSYTNDDMDEIDATLALPENYTVSNINKVYLNVACIIVTFNDGGVYYVSTKEFVDEHIVLHCDEVLSQLSKEGHVLTIANISMEKSNNIIVGVRVGVLMDDLCYYSVYYDFE